MHVIKAVALFKPDTSVKTASFYVTSLWRYCCLIVWEGCDKLEGTGGDPLQPGRGPFLPGRGSPLSWKGMGPLLPGRGREGIHSCRAIKVGELRVHSIALLDVYM